MDHVGNIHATVIMKAIGDVPTKRALQRIDALLMDPRGVQDGKHRRTKLTPSQVLVFKSALIDAFEFAAIWASHGRLPNRVQKRGCPPDNAIFLFIDDIWRACETAGVKPGLRYVPCSESLPVSLYLELSALLWGPTKNARKVFERWQRFRSDLIREGA